MVGLSHVALRELIYEYLPVECHTLWPTEMLNSRRLPSQDIGNTPETLRHEREEFLIPQILGNEKKFIEQSVDALRKINIKGVDINMGCPVKKALKHNYGVSLMGDPAYAKEVVKITTQACNLPVSVKIRSGHDGDDLSLVQFAQGLQQAGASWICLHPRTAKQKRRGSADWRQIKLLKDELDIPVIGNGDIQVQEDVFRMLEETQCDGVMIGRALCARPWLLAQVAKKLGFESDRELPDDPFSEAQEMGKAIVRFIELCEVYFSQEQARRRILFFLKVSHPWLNFGHSLLKKVALQKEIDGMKEAVLKFFLNQDLKLSKYTELRY